jgi:hypothetical protein
VPSYAINTSSLGKSDHTAILVVRYSSRRSKSKTERSELEHLKLLKFVRDSILKPLVIIFWQSLVEGKEPKQLKGMTVVSRRDVKDRPQQHARKTHSLMRIHCKVLASVIKNRMMDQQGKVPQ